MQANATSGVSVAEECVKAFQELRTGRAHRFVVYKVNNTDADESAAEQVVVDKVGGRDAAFEDLVAALPADDCRYAVYDLDFTVAAATAAHADGEAPRSKIFFISW